MKILKLKDVEFETDDENELNSSLGGFEHAKQNKIVVNHCGLAHFITFLNYISFI